MWWGLLAPRRGHALSALGPKSTAWKASSGLLPILLPRSWPRSSHFWHLYSDLLPAHLPARRILWQPSSPVFLVFSLRSQLGRGGGGGVYLLTRRKRRVWRPGTDQFGSHKIGEIEGRIAPRAGSHHHPRLLRYYPVSLIRFCPPKPGRRDPLSILPASAIPSIRSPTSPPI